MRVEIEKKSGFCFGVVNAIKIAEESLWNSDTLYCLGDIVHNGAEIERLQKLGLNAISREDYFQLKNTKVLIRAHGEPPETYDYAAKNNIELIDATCPVVLKLQQRLKKSYIVEQQQQGQIVIFGKEGHAEVVGLNGQADNNAIIIQSMEDVEKIDFTKPITLYSQTTKSVDEFKKISEDIQKKAGNKVQVVIKDTICRQVSNRVPRLKAFVKKFDMILFVAGKKSSNGKFLYEVCSQENPNTKFISQSSELNIEWLKGINSVGICGATSTPQWLMQEVAKTVEQF